MAKRTTAARVCKLIQLYVRLLETDENGYGKCCSCGYVKSWGELNGGHFQPKGRHYNAAAFEEDNVHIQCITCNLFLQGNPAGYSAYMLAEHGLEVMEHIKMLSYKHLETDEIHELGKIYKAKCMELAKTKNFEVKVR